LVVGVESRDILDLSSCTRDMYAGEVVVIVIRLFVACVSCGCRELADVEEVRNVVQSSEFGLIKVKFHMHVESSLGLLCTGRHGMSEVKTNHTTSTLKIGCYQSLSERNNQSNGQNAISTFASENRKAQLPCESCTNDAASRRGRSVLSSSCIYWWLVLHAAVNRAFQFASVWSMEMVDWQRARTSLRTSYLTKYGGTVFS
jgi:hypothetical protein